ncbi:serine/threonine-protein kinase NIM1-like [Centruroides sculpturatus]|uniref:serine/threonine-protein kinase NIM1-like n=1 Tax=Centruroides sculpturatus TaxID=218467 RepID=UPI000C6E0C5F|nr:serine/threonine-protein kinase NIM1-like [Centruroides sculpturatus]XP_023235887.1 serine/threonine-protein kinase NIM1-like [Centruroides sculpturatus]
MPAARISPLVDQRPSITSQATSSSSGSVDNHSASSTSLDKVELTPYQRILQRLNNDEKWQKEITLGRRVGFYRFRGDIGSGNFSQVKAAVHCLSKERVAVKILDKSKLDQKTQKMLSREIISMEGLHHPHIIRLFEVVETLTKIYLVMEYANGGELFHRISTDGRFPEMEAKHIFAQVTAALDHMHQRNIIHRDLKAENVFFAGPNVVKVGDFGFSTQVREREEALCTFCGSPPYAAPELFKDENYVGAYVDIWALGVLLYFMVTGSMPFKAQTVAALKKLILEGHYVIPQYVSDSCCQLVRGILQIVPHYRYTIEQIKNTEWLRNQHFPSELTKYSINTNPDGPFSDIERETRQQLKELGITEEMLKECADKGSRSNITGTYRIIVHKLQTCPSQNREGEVTESVSSAQLPQRNPSTSKHSEKGFRFLKRKPFSGHKKSKTCNIF